MVQTQLPLPPRSSAARAIAGGFVLVPIAGLMAGWRACQAAPLGIADFRTWLGCLEMKARRCQADQGRAPTYSIGELTRLLGVAQRRARASVNRLVAAGLLVWNDHAIAFPAPLHDLEPALDDSIGCGRGSLAIPRRILRFLIAGARAALIATALGVLLRCLSRRRDGYEGRGRVKASWIAAVFDIDLRRVKQARAQLIDLGWIDPDPSPQCTENRHGRAFRIDLAWAAPRDPQSAPHDHSPRGATPHPPSGISPHPVDRSANLDGRRLPPLPPVRRPEIATPSSLHQDPLPERDENQEPGSAGSTGVGLKGSGEQIRPEVAPPGPGSVGTKPAPVLPAPKLADIRVDDLKDTARLLDLLGQAIERKLVGSSEADRMKFVALAEHALGIGKENPPGLFAYLLRGGCWRYITLADEDRARGRLKAHDRGPEPVSGRSAPTAAPGRTSSFVADDPRGDKPSSLSGLLGRLGMVGAGGAVVGGVTSMGQEAGSKPMAEEATSKPMAEEATSKPAGEKPIGLNWRDYLPAEVPPSKSIAEEPASKPAGEKPIGLIWRDYLPKVLGGGV
jgi:hypothetical protein